MMPAVGLASISRARAHQGVAEHDAVGVQDDHVVVAVTPAIDEITNVADLLAGIGVAPAIGQRHRCGGVPGREALFLVRRDIRAIGVAQQEQIEMLGPAGLKQGVGDDLQVVEDPLGVLVVDGHDDRRSAGHRSVSGDVLGDRGDQPDRIGVQTG